MDYEKFAETWNRASELAHSRGEMSVEDWANMSHKLDEISNKYNVDAPKEGEVITNPIHLAFIDGATWGFSQKK